MGKVIFIGVGPGDPKLITLRGKEALGEADVVIYAGSLVNPEILKYSKPDAEIYNSATMNREEILNIMANGVKRGKLVARVHDGDPSIFGAIQEQMDRLDDDGIKCEIIPGVSAMFATAASLKRELTLPAISQTVIITRPVGRTPVPKRESLRELAKHRATMVIFLGVQRIGWIVSELLQGGYPPNTPIAVVHKASWPEEKIISGTLADVVRKVKAAGIKKTALIIVGDVLNPKSYEPSKLYDPSFSHSYRRSDSR